MQNTITIVWLYRVSKNHCYGTHYYFSSCIYTFLFHLENVTCPEFYHCEDSLQCVYLDVVCDGRADCPNEDDESDLECSMYNIIALNMHTFHQKEITSSFLDLSALRNSSSTSEKFHNVEYNRINSRGMGTFSLSCLQVPKST